MIKRFASVFAGVALVGCAATPTSQQQQASDTEIASTWQGLTVFECQEQHAECVFDAGIRPSAQVACAEELTFCIAEQTAVSVEDLASCTLDSVGCTLDSAVGLDISDTVACQQEVVDCAVDTVDDVTGVDLSDVVEPVQELVDGVADLADDVVDEAVEVVEETVEVVGEAVDNVVTNVGNQISCNQDARECLRGNIFNPFKVARCQVEFLECSSEVAADVVDDTLDVAGDLTAPIVDELEETVDCAGEYAECRANGGRIRTCAAELRECNFN